MEAKVKVWAEGGIPIWGKLLIMSFYDNQILSSTEKTLELKKTLRSFSSLCKFYLNWLERKLLTKIIVQNITTDILFIIKPGNVNMVQKIEQMYKFSIKGRYLWVLRHSSMPHKPQAATIILNCLNQHEEIQMSHQVFCYKTAAVALPMLDCTGPSSCQKLKMISVTQWVQDGWKVTRLVCTFLYKKMHAACQCQWIHASSRPANMSKLIANCQACEYRQIHRHTNCLARKYRHIDRHKNCHALGSDSSDIPGTSAAPPRSPSSCKAWNHLWAADQDSTVGTLLRVDKADEGKDVIHPVSQTVCWLNMTPAVETVGSILHYGIQGAIEGWSAGIEEKWKYTKDLMLMDHIGPSFLTKLLRDMLNAAGVPCSPSNVSNKPVGVSINTFLDGFNPFKHSLRAYWCLYGVVTALGNASTQFSLKCVCFHCFIWTINWRHANLLLVHHILLSAPMCL